jgi:hypothetical protein
MLSVEHLRIAEEQLDGANKAVLALIEEGNTPVGQIALLLLSVAQLHAGIVSARAEVGLADEVCALKLALREVIDLGKLKVEVKP